jgi:hypothetical protein
MEAWKSRVHNLYGKRKIASHWYDFVTSREYFEQSVGSDHDIELHYSKAIEDAQLLMNNLRTLLIPPHYEEVVRQVRRNTKKHIVNLQGSLSFYRENIKKTEEQVASFNSLDDYRDFLVQEKAYKNFSLSMKQRQSMSTLEYRAGMTLSEFLNSLQTDPFSSDPQATKVIAAGRKAMSKLSKQVSFNYKPLYAAMKEVKNEYLAMEPTYGRKSQMMRMMRAHLVEAYTLVKNLYTTEVDIKTKHKINTPPVFNSFSESLPQADKEAWDAWFLMLGRLRGELYNNANLLDRLLKNNDNFNKVVLKGGMERSLAPTAFDREHELYKEESGVDMDTLSELQRLSHITSQCQHPLLHSKYEAGIVQLPVYIVSGYMSHDKEQMDGFDEVKYKLTKALGYNVIKNCLVFGLSGVGVSGDDIASAYDSFVSRVKDETLKKLFRSLTPMSPTKYRSGHTYAMLIPIKAIHPPTLRLNNQKHFTLSAWEMGGKSPG